MPHKKKATLARAAKQKKEAGSIVPYTGSFAPSEQEKATHELIILQALTLGPTTTLQFRAMGVATPGARIWSLRRQGYKIVVAAKVQRFAQYVLIEEGGA